MDSPPEPHYCATDPAPGSGPLLAVDAITTWEQVAQQPATDHPR
jgi:hypothetical protein